MLAAGPWRNRITRYGEEAPDQLLAHEKNWRIHPGAQQRALKGVLETVGLVQNVIVSERSGKCLDGHLRIQMAISEGQPTVPITYVDLSPEEEEAILCTLDPLSAMAVKDEAIFSDLVSGMDEAFKTLVDATAVKLEAEVGMNQDPEVKTCKCPECGFEFTVGVAT